MKNMRFWRTALVATLVLTIMLSVTGGTIAWFTDSVTSASNIVKSGTLDVTMEYADGKLDPASAAWQNAANAQIFTYKLWEPGYTDVRHLRIANVGDLAFNYSVKIEAVEGGEVSELAEVIDVYFIDPAQKVENRAALKNVTPIGTLESLLAGMPANASARLNAGEEDVVTIALKMQESAGNEYQNKKIGDFNVKLEAIQATVEEDSFDNEYDADAWIPETQPDSLVITPNEVAQKGGIITVKDAAALGYLSKLSAEWNEMVDGYNAYHYSSAWIIELEADINMMNTPMNTINVYKWGGFDGNGHTISNVVMKDGQTSLFSGLKNNDSGNTYFKNLTVDNITVYAPGKNGVGALCGSVATTISNVTIKNANVTGQKYVGALAGKVTGVVVDCKVIDSVVTSPSHENDAKTVGGLVGYSIGDPNHVTVSGNTVEDVTVTGAYNVGGLLGQAQNETVENNTIKNVIVVSTEALPADASPNEVRSAAVAARSAFTDTTIGTNTVENVTLRNQ